MRRSPDPIVALVRLLLALAVAVALAASTLMARLPATAQAGDEDRLTAVLDGVPIKLDEVATWYCDDGNHTPRGGRRARSDAESKPCYGGGSFIAPNSGGPSPNGPSA